MLAADAATVPCLLLCLLIAGNSVLCSSDQQPEQIVLPEAAAKSPLAPHSPESAAASSPLAPNSPEATATESPLAPNSPEVAAAESPLAPNSPEAAASESPLALNSPEAASSPRESRIIEKTSILRKSANVTTVLRKKTDADDEDDEDDAAAAVKTTTTDFPGPISLESSSARSSMEFRPSVHIGEIHDYESRKSSAGPFNNVQHVKFENSVSIEDDTGRETLLPSSPSSAADAAFHEGDVAGQKRNHRIKFVDTDSRYGSVGVPIEYYVPQQQQQQYQPQHHHHHIVHDEDNDNNNGDDNDNQGHLTPMPMGHEGHVVTFDYPMSHYAEVVTARPVALARPVYPTLITDSQMHLQQQQQQQQYEPGVNTVRAIYAKPSKFHEEVATQVPVRIQHYEYVAATPVAAAAGNEHALPEKPEVPGHHRAISYQLVPQHADTLTTHLAKPDTVLVLSSHRETAYTRTRKFPYKFFHPEPVHQDHEYYYVPEHGPGHGYHMKMRASPWKKIIHLIGAFLPLGLLLAALKPNIVQLDTQNSTQPNIVLSKLRDLPAEHKRGRLESGIDNVRQDPTCEDKSICELIVSGSEPHANLLQNILWNLTNKSTDEEAKKHGLHEIFAAVKRKDCSSIDC